MDGKYYALKFATHSQAYSQQLLATIFEKESAILQELDHPNIIKLYQSVKGGCYMKNEQQSIRSALVFEYAPYNLA